MQWSTRHAVTPEWPIAGFPRSYLSQLTVKNGNDPELGQASLKDLPPRVGENLAGEASELVELVTRKGCCRTLEWFSPWVVCPFLLILVGLASSVANRGGQLYDWYFMVYTVMYLVWPWNFEARFYLPVAPLACLYLWLGAKRLGGWTIDNPKVVAGLGVLAATFCGTGATLYWWRSTDTSFRYNNVVATVFWGVAAVVAAGTWLEPRVVPLLRTHLAFGTRGTGFSRPVKLAGLALFVVAVGVGIAGQLAIGRDNLRSDPTAGATYPDIEAAKWIRDRTPPNSVLMARDPDVFYYYTGRKVVWFPPISDPKVLMEGMRKYGVQYVVVLDRRGETYWQPPEDQCFKRLSVSFPKAFHLVHRGPREEVFELVPAAQIAPKTTAEILGS